MKKTIKNYIDHNPADIDIIIRGRNPMEEHGSTTDYYSGEIGNVPEKFQNAEVIEVWFSLNYDCYIIEIPQLK